MKFMKLRMNSSLASTSFESEGIIFRVTLRLDSDNRRYLEIVKILPAGSSDDRISWRIVYI